MTSVVANRDSERFFAWLVTHFRGGAVVSYPVPKETRDDSVNVLPWQRSGSEPASKPVNTYENVAIAI